jgi:hypothetical protein
VLLKPTPTVNGLPAETDPLEGENATDCVDSATDHEIAPNELVRVTDWLGGVLPAVAVKVRVVGETFSVACPWHSAARKIPKTIPSADRTAQDRFPFI